MLYLYKEFVAYSGTPYPRCMGTFVLFLKDKGWEQVEVQNSGPRSLDRWVLKSPHGEKFEFISWNDGQRTVKTDGGIVVLTDYQMELEVVTIPEGDRAVLRRRIEDAMRKSPGFLAGVIKFALIAKAIRE